MLKWQQLLVFFSIRGYYKLGDDTSTYGIFHVNETSMCLDPYYNKDEVGSFKNVKPSSSF